MKSLLFLALQMGTELYTLRDIEAGKSVIVKKVNGRSSFRRRISEMGFVRGKVIHVLKNAPFRDPIEYEIMGYHISLRRSEAALIEVVPAETVDEVNASYNGTLSFNKQIKKVLNTPKELKVVFVGNPNSGKTSIFNAISGRNEHVGNYSGVTVDAKKAKIKMNGYLIHLTDLPGTYSLSPNSPDELFVRDHLLKAHPDVVINVVDSTNLERNLYLSTQLIDMDIQVILALNMQDEMEKKGDRFDIDQFAKITGIPAVWTIGSKRTGCDRLMAKTIEVAENNEPVQRHIHINYGPELEQSINVIQKEIWKAANYVREFSSRYFALRLLEDDEHTKENIQYLENANQVIATAKKEMHRLEHLMKEHPQTLITNARYGFINGALQETLKIKKTQKSKSTSQRIDQVLTGKYTGFPIFLLFLWIMFQGTFSLGQFPADWIDSGVSWLAQLFGSIMQEGPAKDLIVDGIFGGVGGVLVFLPNIVILFFFISLMEDTGYMSRVAFIMDKLMHLIGLHGKSFIPLIMGFGCNVPAIMSTRTLENRSDRLLTILIIPFMSCSARLPVYILIAGAIFPDSAGTVIFLIYLAGILVSILTALLLKKTMFRSKEAPFVMELPPYRIPTLKSTLRHMWTKAREYLKKMGGVILWASIIVWFLSYFPRTNESIEQQKEQLSKISVQLAQVEEEVPVSYQEQQLDSLIRVRNQMEFEISQNQQYNSYLGRMGRTIEPVIRPIGFDWKIGVSLLSGVIAKEIVISTMGVLYSGDQGQSLSEAIQDQRFDNGKLEGQKIFTQPTTLALLVFVLIYIPCIAVIAAIRKETGKWKWALFNVTYATSLAWILAFIVSKVAGLFF
ncbi:ferrous iron transport protein B [Roseimarinus sediminis]|uniref:ferrous iron transport protein B n=1 Tax=Roseimarinus sediminis TaxID=1610899 RepID=UPI003D1F924A